MFLCLAEYIKKICCKHDLKLEEYPYIQDYQLKGVCRQGYKVSVTCNKCGYHKSYWKI